MSELKPLLRQMIDNNKPYWRSETIRGAHKQLDEHEAKAKAWDRVYEAFEKAENEHEFSNGVCTIMNEYESGESNAKK